MPASFTLNARLPRLVASVMRLDYAVCLSVAIAIAMMSMLSPTVALAGGTDRTQVDYIRVDPADGVVRVKPTRKIADPASCQTTTFMVIPLDDPNLQLFLASLYTAAATDGALVRLFGTGDCTTLPGSETINKVTLFAPD